MSMNDGILIKYYRGACKFNDLKVSTDTFIQGNLMETLDDVIDTGDLKYDVELKFEFERKFDSVFAHYHELVDDTISELEEAINQDEHATKAAQKRLTDNVNRAINFFITERIFGGSESYGWLRGDFLKAVQLPYEIRLHNVPSAIKKLEKYLKSNASNSGSDLKASNPKVYFASLILKAFSDYGLDQLIELANLSKTLPVRKRNAAKKFDYDLLYKGMNEASKTVIDTVMQSLSDSYSERCKRHLERLYELSSKYKSEVDDIHSRNADSMDVYREMKALKLRYIQEVGEPDANVLRSTPEYISIHLESNKNRDLIKVRENLIKWLVSVEVVQSKVLSLDVGLDGFDCAIDLYSSETVVRTLKFKTVFAGGHNIQKLHLRTVHHLAEERTVNPL
ncbi:hypothetical protein [Vibrio sp. R78045]|uniref:hypothetical protein n=1 Tax=Vibrio sp. R78045 TaxID=3093868 RepID=UPI0036F33B81